MYCNIGLKIYILSAFLFVMQPFLELKIKKRDAPLAKYQPSLTSINITALYYSYKLGLRTTFNDSAPFLTSWKPFSNSSNGNVCVTTPSVGRSPLDIPVITGS